MSLFDILRHLHVEPTAVNQAPLLLYSITKKVRQIAGESNQHALRLFYKVAGHTLFLVYHTYQQNRSAFYS